MRSPFALPLLAFFATACATTAEGPDAPTVDARADAQQCTPGSLGQDCTSGQGICRREGKTTCVGGHVECDAVPGTPEIEVCENDVDDDCDGLVDEGFAAVGMPCTVGLGACERTGTYICSEDGTEVACDATPGLPTQELCGNEVDENCNGMVDDGFDDLGRSCDGPDNDFCQEGMWACSLDGSALVCGDTTDDSLDVCNDLDDDCDPRTRDGSQDPRLGQPCDGPDGDTCAEGRYVDCDRGALVCDDQTTNDTTNDPKNCGACDAACQNPNGSTDCVASVCVPSCAAGWQSCGDPRLGCTSLRDTNPGCPTLSLGDVAGDSGGQVRTATGYGEVAYIGRVVETNFVDLIYLSAGAGVQSPPGVRFRVCVACFDCQSQRKVCADPDATGYAEARLARTDLSGDQTFFVAIEVIYLDGDSTSCGDFTLLFGGNLATDDRTCDII